MDYFLKASAIILIFYLTYRFLLQRDTFFNLNRWFLLCGLFVSFTLPVVVIPIYLEVPIFTKNPIGATTILQPNTKNTLFTFLNIITWIYALGALFFLGRFINHFFALLKLLLHKKYNKEHGIYYFKTDDAMSPFSFFNCIVYNPDNFTKTELAQIIAHEKIHIKHKHSVDTILIELSCIVLWFNPFIWLYASYLKLNLEFIADNAVTASLTDKKSYQYTLLKAILPTHCRVLNTPFYNSLIKKRIVMLHKPKSKTANRFKFALIIPVLALFLMSFNTKTIYYTKHFAEQTNEDLVIVFNKNTTNQDLEEAKKTLKEKGITFTYSKLKRKNNEITSISTRFKDDSGHVTMSFTETQTSISAFIFYLSNGKMGVKPLDEEKAKQWHTEFIIHKPFKADSVFLKSTVTNKALSKHGVKTDSVLVESTNNIKSYSTKKEPHLIIIDGKKVSDKDLKDLEPSSIEEIHILKGQMAIEAYGQEAKNGVVIITRKTK